MPTDRHIQSCNLSFVDEHAEHSTARFDGPSGVAVDNGGNVYVADTLNRTIRKVTPAGVVSEC